MFNKKTLRTIGVVLVALPLVMYGSLNHDTSTIDRPALTVGELSLSEAEFNYYVEQELQRLAEQFGIDPGELGVQQNELVRARVIEQFLERFLMVDMVHEIGLVAQDQEVEASVRADSRFSVDGAYAPDRFSALVSDPQFFLAQVRENLAVSKVENIFVGAAIEVPQISEQLANFRGETRFVRQVSVPVDLSDTTLAAVELSEEQLNNYYNTNLADYEIPTRAKFEYIWLVPEEYLDQVQIDEQQLRAEHEKRSALATTNEELQLSLLEVATEQEANTALEEIASGADFATLARERSLDIGSRGAGGDLGFLTREDLDAQIATEIFDSEIGEVVGPFAVGDGWQVFMITGAIGAQVDNFEDIREELLEDVRKFEADTIVAGIADRLSDLIVEEVEQLSDTAQQLEIELRQTEWISAVSEIDSLPAPFSNEQIFATAFDNVLLESGNNSELLTLEDGGYVVIRAIEHEPARVEELSDVKEQVRVAAARESEILRISSMVEAKLRELVGETDNENTIDDLTVTLPDTLDENVAAADSTALRPSEQEIVFDFDDNPLIEIPRYGELPAEIPDIDRNLLFVGQNIIGLSIPAYLMNYSMADEALLVYRIENIETGESDEQLLEVIGGSVAQSESLVLIDGLLTELSADREYSVNTDTDNVDS